MAVLSSVRKRLPAVARWLAPSVVCACAGALGAGIVEGIAAATVSGAVVTTGFLALIVVPALVVASALGRGLYAAWRPAALVASVVEDDGAAPRLAGWVAVVYAAALALAWAMFQGTWLLASWTQFKPLVIGFAEPIVAVATLLAIVIASRPAATGFAWLARAIDRRWRNRGRSTLLRPRRIFVGAAIVASVTVYTAWRWIVKRKLGPLDTGVLDAPAAAIAATVLAHAAWHRVPSRVRTVAGALVGALAAGALGFAVTAVRTSPSLTLEIWGDQPLAGLAIEHLFDLDSIRGRISLAEYRPVDRPGAAHPDIILVTIDTVRADHTPPYGGTAEMPVLAELARRGTVFLNAFAPSNVTRRSIPSMIIGLQPNRIRGRVVGWALRVDPRHVLLAERLRAGGYETAGFMCCKGFWGDEARTGLQRGLEHLEIEYSGARLARLARAWLDERAKRPPDRPLFLWIHLIEPHNWTSGSGLDLRTADDKRKAYDRTLTQSDAALLALFGPDAGPPERAPIAIVTADHGESLGDHGAPYHSTDLYNSNIHVPFVIAGPGIKPQRVAETVSLTDLTPTIIELAGFDPPRDNSIDGRSVADLATAARPGNTDGGTAFAAMIKDRSNAGGITAIVRGGWKLIDNGVGFELYDLRADPAERQNLIGGKPQLVDALKLLLKQKQALGDRSTFD